MRIELTKDQERKLVERTINHFTKNLFSLASIGIVERLKLIKQRSLGIVAVQVILSILLQKN